ncbi:MAG: hypothetical protein JWN63_3427 [Candidatus Acidoferrum typicum]|nr:hypothetical protein [Candidatus Acidoferrum typicum]
MVEPLSSDGLLSVHKELIQLAADLVRGTALPHEFDDDNFYKSTPRAERKRVMRALGVVEELLKVHGIRVRRIADKLSQEIRNVK